jgi:hypothetical protein
VTDDEAAYEPVLDPTIDDPAHGHLHLRRRVHGPNFAERHVGMAGAPGRLRRPADATGRTRLLRPRACAQHGPRLHGGESDG